VNRGLFLDRDGTVIEELGYLSDPDQVRLLPGSVEALASLQAEGWKLVIVSNQSGVGRRLITADQMDAVQRRFLEIVRGHGIQITASYMCIHTPDEGCECRKPSPFLLHRAAKEYSIDLQSSWMIGDREGDILCGKNAGCSTIWLRNGLFSVADDLPTLAVDTWTEIYRKIGGAADEGKGRLRGS
jgi:D-glycero-D-manno-heptose 1,7-bisphosphate phosphatase